MSVTPRPTYLQLHLLFSRAVSFTKGNFNLAKSMIYSLLKYKNKVLIKIKSLKCIF